MDYDCSVAWFPRYFPNQFAASFATTSSVPGSSNRWVAPGMMTIFFSVVSFPRAALFELVTD